MYPRTKEGVEEWLDKADNEGGWKSAVLGYGINNIDDPNYHSALISLRKAWDHFNSVIRVIITETKAEML